MGRSAIVTNMPNEQKPQWMIDHEASDTAQFQASKSRDLEIFAMLGDIKDKLDPEHKNYINKSLEAKIDPVYDAYNTAGTMARWGKITVGTIVLILTGWAAWLTIITKH